MRSPAVVTEELLRARMMRGAVAGPPPDDSVTLRRCIGTDNGRPCTIVPLPGENRCLKHQKEEIVYCKAKLQNGKPCRVVVAKGHDYCRRHQEEIDKKAAAVEQAQSVPQEEECVQIGSIISGEAVHIPEPCFDSQTFTGDLVKKTAEAALWPEKGLSALLRPAPQGILIPFDPDEMATLADAEVSPEHIRQLVLMGLEGKLVPRFE